MASACVAFCDPKLALLWSFHVTSQLSMIDRDGVGIDGIEVFDHPVLSAEHLNNEEGENFPAVFKGMRSSIALHTAEFEQFSESINRETLYYGEEMDKLSRLLTKTCEGEIVFTTESFSALLLASSSSTSCETAPSSAATKGGAEDGTVWQLLGNPRVSFHVREDDSLWRVSLVKNVSRCLSESWQNPIRHLQLQDIWNIPDIDAMLFKSKMQEEVEEGAIDLSEVAEDSKWLFSSEYCRDEDEDGAGNAVDEDKEIDEMVDDAMNAERKNSDLANTTRSSKRGSISSGGAHGLKAALERIRSKWHNSKSRERDAVNKARSLFIENKKLTLTVSKLRTQIAFTASELCRAHQAAKSSAFIAKHLVSSFEHRQPVKDDDVIVMWVPSASQKIVNGKSLIAAEALSPTSNKKVNVRALREELAEMNKHCLDELDQSSTDTQQTCRSLIGYLGRQLVQLSKFSKQAEKEVVEHQKVEQLLAVSVATSASASSGKHSGAFASATPSTSAANVAKLHSIARTLSGRKSLAPRSTSISSISSASPPN